MGLGSKAEIVNPTELEECFSPFAFGNPGNLHAILSVLLNTDVLISNRDYKLHAVATAMGGMKIDRRLTRMRIGHIDEPNHLKQTSEVLRGKSDESVAQFKRDYPLAIRAIEWFKQLKLQLLIQDVRPKSGESGGVLSGLTNPPDTITKTTIGKYIAKGFDHGPSPTTIRLENGFDRPVILFDSTTSKVVHSYPYKPVVAGIYINYEKNPLNGLDQVEGYLNLCAMGRGNDHLQRTMKAAGGLMNEHLLLFAVLKGIGIQTSLFAGIQERTENIPVKVLLESIYPQAMIEALARVHPIVEDSGRNEEKLRMLALTAHMLKDFADGGSWDAIKALYDQRGNWILNASVAVNAIDLKPNMDLVI